jgi:hypothetical protein
VARLNWPAQPSAPFPTEAKQLQQDITATLNNLSERFPNLKIAYLSSRIYGGYAVTPLNPEPYAYESGFAVKWSIEAQITGASELNYDPAHGVLRSPWIAWGPYLWPTAPRAASKMIWCGGATISGRTGPILRIPAGGRCRSSCCSF